MTGIRIIARLDIKGTNLIKGVHLEGLRVIGSPNEFAKRYYEEGIDEMVYMDTVASLYGRNNLTQIIRDTANDVFVPITVGGGIRCVDDVAEILLAGADKVAVNTEATKRPELISEISRRFGSQCMVLSIEARKMSDGHWTCMTDNGREATSLKVVEWAMRGAELGAGEILLTSVDKEGTREGFDIALVRAVTDAVSIPVIASGGFGVLDDFEQAASNGRCQAVAIADGFHYGRITPSEIRKFGLQKTINVRVTPDLLASGQ